MKPIEILSSLPPWSTAAPETVLDSPAFAMPCRLGDTSGVLRHAPVDPAESEMLALTVAFGDEAHMLCLSRSPGFPELDKIWDSRAEVPEMVLLALVERECGPLFQFLENAVRKQLKLIGLVSAPASQPHCGMIAFQVGDILFSITRSGTVTSALGLLRNLDLAHEAIRAQSLPAEIEYASFVLPEADLVVLAPGDAVLLPEIETVPPRLVVDGRFVIDANGVAPYAADTFLRVRAAEGRNLALGEVFDAVESPPPPPPAVAGMQLRLIRSGRGVATGHLDRIGDQNAFVVEAAGT